MKWLKTRPLLWSYTSIEAAQHLNKTYDLINALIFRAIAEKRFNETEMSEPKYEDLDQLINFLYLIHKSAFTNFPYMNPGFFCEKILDYNPLEQEFFKNHQEHLSKHVPELESLLDPDLFQFWHTDGEVTLELIKDSAINHSDKFELLTSKSAREAYKLGVEYEKIKNFPKEQLEKLLSPQSINVLKTGKIAISELIMISKTDLSWTDFCTLFSYQAIELYKTSKVSPSDLLSIINDWYKFNLLTSNWALIAYKAGIACEHIKDLSCEQIKRLTSNSALDTFQSKKVNLDDLISISGSDTSDSKFALLTSGLAIDAYKAGKVTLRDLASLPKKTIDLLICDSAINAYKGGKNPADYLDEFKKAKKETHRALKKLLEHSVETSENNESFVSAIGQALPENIPVKEKNLILTEAGNAFDDLKKYRSEKHKSSFLKLLNTITQAIVGLFGANKLSEFANKINDSLTLQVLDEKTEDQGKPKNKFASKLDESRKNIPKNSNIPSP